MVGIFLLGLWGGLCGRGVCGSPPAGGEFLLGESYPRVFFFRACEGQRFFAGHWLYFNGATVLSPVKAGEKESVLKVSDASLFETDTGRYRNANADAGLCLMGPDGRPDWKESEQVEILDVDRANNTIRVRRGCFGTAARAFPAGKTYMAAHCSEGPWGANSHLLWYYNHATTCPKDARGRSCTDVQVEELGGLLGPGGALASFDGLEFDVLNNTPGKCGRKRGPDCDADGRADGGILDGVNVYGKGVVEFCRDLRAGLGEGKIIQADGATRQNSAQRAFGILNGIESEGWPGHWDSEIRDWSGGLNRHFFWSRNARPPVFNYINHKFIIPGTKTGTDRVPEVPFPIHRLVFAAAVFTDSAICYSYLPPGGGKHAPAVWDEFVMGKENRPAWLGKPLGPAVRLATDAPDLLRGEGNPAGKALAARLESDDALVESTADGVKLSARKPDAESFHLRLNGVPCDGPDLFVFLTARADPIKGQPEEMARELSVGIAAPAGNLVRPEMPPMAGIALRGSKETSPPGSSARLEYEDAFTLDEKTLPAYFVHPPYADGVKGYVFWGRQVAVPEKGVLEFSTGLSATGAAKSDGVTFLVQAAPDEDGHPGEFREIYRYHEKSARWTPHSVPLREWTGETVWLKFVADCGPDDNTVADQGYWGDVRVTSAGGKPETPAAQFSTWANAKAFTSGFYFNDVRSRQVDLEIVAESSEPVWISTITAHARPDVICREFEHGLVLANPSPRPYTFDLVSLFPGHHFRRIQGTPQQDLQANNGEAVEDKLTLGPQEGLFLVKEETPSPDAR